MPIPQSQVPCCACPPARITSNTLVGADAEQREHDKASDALTQASAVLVDELLPWAWTHCSAVR